MGTNETDLNAPANPNDVPQVLRNAAQKMREQTGELQSAWGDAAAGLIWTDFAKILERAAASCDRALIKRRQ